MMWIRTGVFLILNFGALAIGSLYTTEGVSSEWYTMLNKAPWTPPGWVFGAAWTTIMVCFSFYMGWLWKIESNRNFLAVLFGVQWLLNISWNPLFFYLQEVTIALVSIVSLTLLVGVFFFRYLSLLKVKSLGILPYLLWLIIATSLNAYILIEN